MNEHGESAAVIVVLEDDVSTRKLISKYLTQDGHTVHQCGDIDAGKAAIMEHRPDLVCLDLGLPVGSGFRVAEWMRGTSELENIPIIVVTARTGVEDHARAMEAGADRLVQKPFRSNELVKNVRILLKHGRRSTRF